MLSIFLGTCEAVRAMHHYVAGPTAVYPPTSTSTLSPSNRTGGIRGEEDDEDENEDGPIMTGGEGEALIGGMGGLTGAAEEEGELTASQGEQPSGKSQPWAHRDIKPVGPPSRSPPLHHETHTLRQANIMLADDGRTPILMDFGSALPGRIPIPNRSVALTQQDIAAEHCSMPFRAPELFDVREDLTEAVDIWSLGCTLYACAYGSSPFETLQQSEFGGSIAMAVLGGKYTFPADGSYSEGLKELIKMMIIVKVAERPSIQAVIEATSKALARLD